MINKVTIGGYVVNINKRISNNGKNIVYLTVKTKNKWKTKEGIEKERSEIHQCQCYGKMTDLVIKDVSVGQFIILDGYLNTEHWTDDIGISRSLTRIQATNIQLLDLYSDHNDDFNDDDDYIGNRKSKK